MSDAWRDELRALTDAIGGGPPKREKATARPRTSQYSAETGRLIPPPSRAMSRGGPSRGASRGFTATKQLDMMEDPAMEDQVPIPKCTILSIFWHSQCKKR